MNKPYIFRYGKQQGIVFAPTGRKAKEYFRYRGWRGTFIGLDTRTHQQQYESMDLVLGTYENIPDVLARYEQGGA